MSSLGVLNFLFREFQRFYANDPIVIFFQNMGANLPKNWDILFNRIPNNFKIKAMVVIVREQVSHFLNIFPWNFRNFLKKI